MKLFLNNNFKSIVLLTTFVILLAGVSQVRSDSVCTLKTLKMELIEDINDNGMLDCLRKIDAPHTYIETEQEKNNRIMAQWDSSCSFETNTEYKEILKREFGISTLVDANGEPVSSDFEDQVDICEIVRAAVANGDLGKEINMRRIPKDIVNKIDCAGPLGDKEGPRICAATSSSFYNKSAWNIFLKSSVITLAGKPTFIQKQYEEDYDKEDAKLSDNMKNMISKNKFMGKLYNMLDKKKNAASNQVTKESNIHFFKLRDNNITLQIKNTDNSFKRIDSNAVTINGIKNGKSYSMFAFYMISTDTIDAKCSFRFNLNGNIVSETRSNFEAIKNGSASAATVYNIQNNASNNQFTLDYRSTKEIPVSLAGHNGNGQTGFAVEAVLWPHTNIYKYVNSEDFEIKGSKTFVALNDEKNKNNQVELQVNNDKSEARYYIITYNIAQKFVNEVTAFGTVLRSKNEVEWNTLAYSGGKMLSNHGAKVVSIPATEKKTYSIEYIMDGESDTYKMENNILDNAIVSLNAIELPTNVKVETYEPSESVDLTQASGQFKPLNLHATKSFTEKTKCLILFRINIKLAENSNFVIKLKVNDAMAQRSIMSWFGNEYASGQGYVLHEFDKGNYDIKVYYNGKGLSQLEKNNANVENDAIKQVAEMTIIEFN